MSDQLPATTNEAFAEAAAKHHVPATRNEGGFLQFNGKSGDWSFGTDDEPVDGCEAILMSKLIEQGWIRWGTKPPLKVFSLVTAGAYPTAPQSVEGVDQDGRPCTHVAQAARQFMGKFVGEVEALGQFIFNTSSMGGVENTSALYSAIIMKAADSPYFFPRVKFGEESYKRSTGKVYKPVFEIVGWHDVDGNAEGAAPKKLESKGTEDAGEEDAPPARKRRRRTA